MKKSRSNRRLWRKRGGKAAFELGIMQGGVTKLTERQKRWAKQTGETMSFRAD